MNVVRITAKQSFFFGELLQPCLVVLFFYMDIWFYKALADHVVYLLVAGSYQLQHFRLLVLRSTRHKKADSLIQTT